MKLQKKPKNSEEVKKALEIFSSDPLLSIQLLKGLLYWEELEEVINNKGFLFIYNKYLYGEMYDSFCLYICIDHSCRWNLRELRVPKEITTLRKLRKMSIENRNSKILKFLNELEKLMIEAVKKEN